MPHNNRPYSKRAVLHVMNRALDGDLSPSAWASLSAHLGASGQDSALWNNMQQVDRLLGSEPMAQAPVDFCATLMATIAALPTPRRLSESQKHRNDFRTMMGLLLSVIILMPLVVSVLVFVQHWLSDPAALNALLHQLMLLISTMGQAITSILPVIAPYAIGSVIVAFVVTVLSTSLLAVGMRWHLSLRREMVVYRIPVIAA
jgi:hypothetical protein